MTIPYHTSVSLAGIKDEDGNRTFIMSGSVTKADEGKAVTLDTSAANTVKLATDGSVIIGRLEVFEPTRNTCTIQLEFTDPLPILAGQTVNVGDTLVGAGGGFVKSAATPNWALNYVVEVANGAAVCVQY